MQKYDLAQKEQYGGWMKYSNYKVHVSVIRIF